MRTRTKTVYKFAELSERAKEKARNWYRSIDTEIAWADENRGSMEAFSSLFPIKVKDWSYGGQGSGVTFEITSENVESLTGLRLHRWIMNNVSERIYKGKYYSTLGTYDADGKFHYKFRHSKCQFEASCPLTGYCMDDTLLDPIYKFLKRPAKDTTLRDLLEDGFNAWVRDCEAEIEDQGSDEAIDEMLTINEHEFDNDGRHVF